MTREWAMMDIRKSNQRGHANHGWLDSHFSFRLQTILIPSMCNSERSA